MCFCYLSFLHYNQPSLVEDHDSFCTAMSHNSTGLIFYQHSEWTLFSVTHILLINEKEKSWEMTEEWNHESICSVLPGALSGSLCLLPGPGHIGRGQGRSILGHQNWCNAPPPPCGTHHCTLSLCNATSCSRTHCERESLLSKHSARIPLFKHVCKHHHFTRCCSPRRWSVLMHMACCYGNRDTVPVQCSLCGDVPEINPPINHGALF